ncbi:alginate export family protein [Flavobacterium aestivum]|uniref:alginate export family protein n=1 Tax=Flavobacterium aestivum TaxID=3003257 RepID=UPI0022864216|nr:alginate export family protein [Flavobacterium aestivum]
MGKNNLLIYKIAFLFALVINPVIAQNKISLLRYDDDFTSLKNDSLKKGLDQLKYVPLRANNYISFGGELREQFQVYKNINFGDVPPTYQDISTNQLWHRLMVHSNVEVGNHFRFFIQFNNTLRFLNDNPIAPEIDENQLSLHQAFAEVKLDYLKFRVGRQELLYGNNRLITVREGPNTRLTFDGIVIKKAFKNGGVDFLAVSKVISKQYVFDDESFKEGLIGIYGTQYFNNRKIGLDYFALDFQSKLRKYNYQTGSENRQTYGIRLFSNYKRVNFEVEGAYQSGKFNDVSISAYTVLGDVNVTVLPANKGIIGFMASVASGDNNNGDSKLNTYNLLYAKPAYGLAVPIGATNMVSLNPYIKINPIQRLNVLGQVFFLARNSNQDGTYSPGMIQNRPKPNLLFSSTEKELGELYVVETNYQQTKNLWLSFDASYFNAGNYPITTVSGKNVKYISFKTTFKF